MATAHPFLAGKTRDAGLSALFGAVAEASRRVALLRKADNLLRFGHLDVEVEALVGEAIPEFFDRSVEPAVFSSGDAAIALGWSYIDDLEDCLSSVNTAMNALNSKASEIARNHFGAEIADRVWKLQEGEFDAAKYRLDYRLSSISRAFAVSGTLIETDGGGKLSLGRFTLRHDGRAFSATVGSDQHAVVSENGTARLVSVHQVVANLATGRLSL